MDITTLVNTRLQIAQLGQTTTGSNASSTVRNLTSTANDRLGRELQSTNVKLSAYGQIKSAFGAAQTAASGLTTAATSKTATNADIEKAAQAFVNAYNQAAQSVSSATSTSSKQTGALASESRARSAGNDLTRSLTGGNGLANLKQAGIALNANGTLSLDTKALQNALQSNASQTRNALSGIGQQVGSATERELASTGNVGLSVGKLSSRAQTLSSQQATLQQQAASLQSQLEKQSTTLNYATANGLAAYQNILG
jgi:flagellar hook-associated protein 2